MSQDVAGDFARLHGTAQIGATGLGIKTHPLFSAAHSLILSHKYGQADPYTYMKNPHLRAMDTRQAALEGLQTAGGHVSRAADYFRPSVPGPVPPMPGANTPMPPTSPGAYNYTKRPYSARMSTP